MATDSSPTRNGLILGIAVASVFTLGALKFVFDSYYHYMMDEELARKAAPPTELRAARADEHQRLTSGPVPIDKAIAEVAKAREALIEPQQSADEGPLVGWSKLPRRPAAPTASPDGGAAVAAAMDAGANAPAPLAPTTGDAGATPNASLDAGAATPHASSDAGANGPSTLHPGATAPNVTDAGGGRRP